MNDLDAGSAVGPELTSGAGVVEDIVSRHRRRRVRNRTLGAAATGVAAGTAVGLIAVASEHRSPCGWSQLGVFAAVASWRDSRDARSGSGCSVSHGRT